MKYAHQNLNEDYQALAGYYTPIKEVRLPYEGREVLYIIGEVNIDGACCAASSWTYAIVPGYITQWHIGINENGLPITEVERIKNDQMRQAIIKFIQVQENLQSVEVW